MKNYNRSNIQLAKNLRKNMTPWERKLWYEYLSQYPLRFQRQKAIGSALPEDRNSDFTSLNRCFLQIIGQEPAG